MYNTTYFCDTSRDPISVELLDPPRDKTSETFRIILVDMSWSFRNNPLTVNNKAFNESGITVECRWIEDRWQIGVERSPLDMYQPNLNVKRLEKYVDLELNTTYYVNADNEYRPKLPIIGRTGDYIEFIKFGVKWLNLYDQENRKWIDIKKSRTRLVYEQPYWIGKEHYSGSWRIV